MDNRQVRQERSGWRDEALSRRHREWGWDLPCVDIDFLMIVYDRFIPKALIEYKHENCPQRKTDDPGFKAVRALSDLARLPFFAVRYKADLTNFCVSAINDPAIKYLSKRFHNDMTEREYVEFLYRIRGRKMPADLFDAAGKLKPAA